MRSFCIQQQINFKKTNPNFQVLEIKGYDTVSTKADEDDQGLSFELPSRKLRRCFVSRRDDHLNKLAGINRWANHRLCGSGNRLLIRSHAP